MARYSRARRYYSSARSYGRAAFRGRSYNKKGFGVYMNAQFALGAAASFLPITVPKVANTAILAVAVAPVKLPGGVKMAAQGYVLGKLIQQFTGNPLASGNTATTNTGWY